MDIRDINDEYDAASPRDQRQAAIEILGAAIVQIIPESRASGDAIEHATATAEALLAHHHKTQLALRNVLAMAGRLRKTDPETAAHLIRFCASAGVEPSILRQLTEGSAILDDAAMEEAWEAALEESVDVDAVTFKSVWAAMEERGYRYEEDALEQVRFGWKLAEKALVSHLDICRTALAIATQKIIERDASIARLVRERTTLTEDLEAAKEQLRRKAVEP
jgi:hypothetical protein